MPRTDRPSSQAMRRLQHYKRKMRKRNVLDALETLVRGYEKAKQTDEKTEDLDLLKETVCPVRFEFRGSWFCGKYAPRSVKKLISIKICDICQANTRRKPKPIAKTDRVSLQATNWAKRGGLTHDQVLDREAQRLLDGTHKKSCLIAKKALKLMELPCVAKVADPKNPDLKLNCRHVDCESRIKAHIRRIYGVTMQ